ncbi:MAG: double zinc ribbon domain-containing protein [Myxococcota bacterium]
MTSQAFTRNHRDHSNDTGFQFEFFCDKCGNGHRSSFKHNAVGVAASVIKAAGALFGGAAYRAGWGADHVKDALRGPAWDAAFKEAIEECRPRFRQCTQCGKWVCPEVCWNNERGLCENCAPDLREHAPMIQAQVAVEQAWQQAREGDQLRGADLNAKPLSVAAAHACTQCRSQLAEGARFCANCGTAVVLAAAPAAQAPKFCSNCGGKLEANARFCAGCGNAVK